mgnify:CR=1 FL=1
MRERFVAADSSAGYRSTKKPAQDAAVLLHGGEDVRLAEVALEAIPWQRLDRPHIVEHLHGVVALRRAEAENIDARHSDRQFRIATRLLPCALVRAPRIAL